MKNTTHVQSPKCTGQVRIILFLFIYVYKKPTVRTAMTRLSLLAKNLAVVGTRNSPLTGSTLQQNQAQVDKYQGKVKATAVPVVTRTLRGATPKLGE